MAFWPRALGLWLSVFALETALNSANAEEMVRICDRLQFDAEVNATPRYHLRYRATASGDRTYFVWDSASSCSFVLSTPLDPETDRIWMFRMAELTVPTQFVEPAPVRIPRFLTDRETESRIVRALFRDCRTDQPRKLCRDLITEDTSTNSAVLQVVRQSVRSKFNLFRDHSFTKVQE